MTRNRFKFVGIKKEHYLGSKVINVKGLHETDSPTCLRNASIERVSQDFITDDGLPLTIQPVRVFWNGSVSAEFILATLTASVFDQFTSLTIDKEFFGLLKVLTINCLYSFTVSKVGGWEADPILFLAHAKTIWVRKVPIEKDLS